METPLLILFVLICNHFTPFTVPPPPPHLIWQLSLVGITGHSLFTSPNTQGQRGVQSDPNERFYRFTVQTKGYTTSGVMELLLEMSTTPPKALFKVSVLGWGNVLLNDPLLYCESVLQRRANTSLLAWTLLLPSCLWKVKKRGKGRLVEVFVWRES